MNIGINCLKVNPTYLGGVNTYILGLLDGFSQIETHHKFQIYVKQKNKNLFKKYIKISNFEVIELPYNATLFRKVINYLANVSTDEIIHKKLSNFINKDIAQIMDQQSDIIYTGTLVLFPYCNKKPTFISMHDIQHIHYPENFSKQQLIYRKNVFNISAKYSKYFIVSSEFIKNDILNYYTHILPQQITVIPPGVEIYSFTTHDSKVDIFQKYKIPKEYIIYPAQLWQHKNHITVLKALQKISSDYGKKIGLVMTGGKYSASTDIFSYIKRNNMNNIVHLENVPYSDLVVLYKNARLLINAVIYEASSFPILEAAASGVPIIASNTPPNKELAQKLAINFFETLDYEDLADLIMNIWDDHKLMVKQIQNNSIKIHDFSWENVARNYLTLFEKKVNTNA